MDTQVSHVTNFLFAFQIAHHGAMSDNAYSMSRCILLVFSAYIPMGIYLMIPNVDALGVNCATQIMFALLSWQSPEQHRCMMLFVMACLTHQTYLTQQLLILFVFTTWKVFFATGMLLYVGHQVLLTSSFPQPNVNKQLKQIECDEQSRFPRMARTSHDWNITLPTDFLQFKQCNSSLVSALPKHLSWIA